MPVESAADRLAFFDADEFGVSLSYTLNGGATTTGLFGLWDKDYSVSVPGEFGIGIGTHPATLRMREADIPSGYGDGDQVVIASVTYDVRAHQLDGTGMALLELEVNG